eukprot:9431325-Alexandrium_andersonii.AAC.1
MPEAARRLIPRTAAPRRLLAQAVLLQRPLSEAHGLPSATLWLDGFEHRPLLERCCPTEAKCSPVEQ